MKELNLSEILRGHEGEIFYSPILGDLKLERISDNELILYFKSESNPKTDTFLIGKNGKLVHGADEIAVYPSKDQRDWGKWIEEQKPKIPKTWSELLTVNKHSKVLEVKLIPVHNGSYQNYHYEEFIWGDSAIEKAAMALLKIYQLIERGYGGNVPSLYTSGKWTIDIDSDIFKPIKLTSSNFRVYPIFHTEEQVKEFLKYPENIQLLKDYCMI